MCLASSLGGVYQSLLFSMYTNCLLTSSYCKYYLADHFFPIFFFHTLALKHSTKPPQPHPINRSKIFIICEFPVERRWEYEMFAMPVANALSRSRGRIRTGTLLADHHTGTPTLTFCLPPLYDTRGEEHWWEAYLWPWGGGVIKNWTWPLSPQRIVWSRQNIFLGFNDTRQQGFIELNYYTLYHEWLRRFLDYQFLHINWWFRGLYDMGGNSTGIPMVWYGYTSQEQLLNCLDACKKTTVSRG